MSAARSLFPSVTILLVSVAMPAGALFAQAPRETAEAKVGDAKVSVEFGCPPWTEQRRRQMEQQLPIGALWRMGADDRTTIVITGGAIRLGDLVVEEGGLGLNARHVGDHEWAFLLYDGGEEVASEGDNTWETPVAVDEKSDPATPRLTMAFVDDGRVKALVARFGPFALRAPVAPVTVKEAELALGGETTTAKWFSVAAADPPRAGAWMRTGSTPSFFIGDVNAAFDVELKLDAASCTVRCSNRGRAKIAEKIAAVDRALERLKKSGGADAANASREKQALEEQKAKLADDLKELGAAPVPCEVTVPLAAAKSASGRIGAEIVRRGKALVLVVSAGDRAGEAPLDEAKVLPPGEKAGSKEAGKN